MKRFLLISAILLLRSCALAQSGTTLVTATVKDVNNNVYSNCQWSVVFMGQNTTPGAGPYTPSAYLNGQQGTCDSFGNFTVNLGDNINTITPTPSQWSFSICSASGYLGGPFCKTNVLITITGASQNLTSILTPLMPPLPQGGGGGSVVGTPNQIQVIAGQVSFPGTVIFPGSVTSPKVNNVVQLDGTFYPLTNAGLTAAIAAACNGTIPGKVLLPPTPAGTVVAISAQTVVPSNCTIQGPGRYATVLQAQSSYNAGTMFSISGKSNVKIEGFAIDANRASNSNTFEVVHIDNSTNVSVNEMLIENGRSTGISLNGTDANVTVRNSEIKNTGVALPSAAGGGVGVSPGGAMSGLIFEGNYIHGNNLGIAVFSSSTTDQLTGLKIINNTVNGNADDAISLQANHNLGGSISQAQIEGNEAGCNGWLANGTGFSANCTPDFLQNGASGSTSGVGVDVTGVLINAPTIVGNNVHDNVFDGISIGTQMNATVNTSGSTITCATCGVSAPPLNTRWITGQIVTVNAAVLAISSCASITTCTTTTPAGTHTNAAFIGPTTVNAVVSGNVSFHNIATGYFNYYSDGNQFSGNTANLNGLEGFGLDASTGVVYSGGSAISNDTSNNGSHNAGFLILLGLQTQIKGVFTNDYQSFQTQQAGVLVSGSSVNTVIESNGLNAPSTAVADSGTNTFYNNGSTISLGGQVFTWPAATGTLCTTTSCVGSVGGQIKGQPSFGATTTTLSTSAGTLYVSGFCGATLTCPNSTDESTAIQAAVTQLKNGGSSGATGHIIDDMCGVQTWSVEPFTGFAGLFETQGNCSITNTHIISLDGVSTITLPSSMRWVGTGGNGFAQVPTNSWIQACNSIIQPCVNSNGAGGLGFVVQQCAIGSTTYSAGSSQLTITCSSGAPFTTCASTFPCSSNTTGSLTAVNSVQQYRLLCINASATLSNNGCWTYKTTTSATAPQAFVVNVPGSGLASCAATCGTVYLETPMISIGNGGGGGVYGTEIRNVVVVGSYLPGVGGIVNGQGEEGTSFGPAQFFATPAYYARLDQSGAFGGQAGGDTNSAGADTLSGNMTPLVCKNATCACAGTNIPATGGHGSCSSTTPGTPGTVNLGDYITCGANQGTVAGAGSFATIYPDPCTNPNFVGVLTSGASFNQGPGRIRGHITVSISDKSIGGGKPIPQMQGSGKATGTQTATTAVGIMCIGSHCTYDDTHTEYFSTAYEVCGNSARNATWQLAYSVATAGGAVIPQTEGVIFDGGFSAFEVGGTGFDIGQAGAGATCGDISIRGVNVGLGSGNAMEDNISGNSCSDATISYFLGHGTNPMFLTSCSTLIGLESPGLADSALNVNALPYIGALGVFTGLNAPTSPNGVPQSVIEVPSGGSGTPVQYALPGVGGRSVTGATATDTILATDCNPTRVTYLTTVDVAVTLPTAATLGVPNCTFKVVNGTATLHTITITPTTWTIGAGGGTPGASLALSWGQEAVIFVDPNSATNWVADVTEQGFTAGSGITITRSASGPSVSAAATGANTALSNLAAVAINLGLTPGSTNTIDLGSNSKYWANLWATTVNCGIAATASCSISGAGSTSGTATITWPAIAGTVANPLAFSNALQLPVGAQASPALVFASSSTRGFYANSATKTCFAAGGGTDVQCYQSNADFNVANTVPYSWSSTAQASGNPDTGVSRGAALVVDMGNGTQGDTTAVVKAAGYMSVGTKFTTNSGCSETTLVGGATAGKFTSGSAIACTVIVTMGNTATAPNGWSCWFNDQTAIPAIAIRQTASNATTASFLMTVGSGDVIDFGCEGY